MSNQGQRPREHNRYNVQAVARVKKHTSTEWTDVKVVSLSSMGAAFASSGHFKAGDSLEFYMEPASQATSPYHLSARVVWIRDGQVGVEFTGNLATG